MEVALHFAEHAIAVVPCGRTTQGVSIELDSVQLLSAECSDEELAQAIRTARGQAGAQVPHPTDWKTRVYQTQVALGFKSERKFMAATKYANVEFKEAGVRLFVPRRDRAGRWLDGGFDEFVAGAEVDAELARQLRHGVRLVYPE